MAYCFIHGFIYLSSKWFIGDTAAIFFYFDKNKDQISKIKDYFFTIFFS